MALARIELSTGREVELTELYLESTYGGMLEGYPCAKINDRILDRLPDLARRHFPYDGMIHVVEPTVTPLDDHGRSWPFGPPESLPSVICVGRLYPGPIKPEADLSGLVLVWFQDAATVPTDEDAPEYVRELKWDELAHDGEW